MSVRHRGTSDARSRLSIATAFSHAPRHAAVNFTPCRSSRSLRVRQIEKPSASDNTTIDSRSESTSFSARLLSRQRDVLGFAELRVQRRASAAGAEAPPARKRHQRGSATSAEAQPARKRAEVRNSVRCCQVYSVWKAREITPLESVELGAGRRVDYSVMQELSGLDAARPPGSASDEGRVLVTSKYCG